MTHPLTKRQRACYDAIADYQDRNRGLSPSYAELCEALGVASKNSVSRLINGLEVRGALTRLPKQPRSLRLLDLEM